MAFSQAQVQQFRERGFLNVPDFLADCVDALRSELERLKEEGILRNVATIGDGATVSEERANLQLLPLYPHSRLYRALPFAPRVIEHVEQLIGSPIVLHLDQLFLKPPKIGMGTAWHQDNAYFKVSDPLRGTAMWVATHDCTIENGTMQLIPGRQLEELHHDRDPNSNHHIRCWPDESEAVPVEIPAGGVAFFCYGTPHCTKDNNSDHERAGLAFHFLHRDLADDDFLNSERARPLLSGPESTGGKKEHGERIDFEAELAAVRARR